MELPPDEPVDILDRFPSPAVATAASDLLFLALLESVMSETEGMNISGGLPFRGGGGVV